MAFIKAELLKRLDERTEADKAAHAKVEARRLNDYEMLLKDWQENSAPRLVGILREIANMANKGKPVGSHLIEQSIGTRYSSSCPNYLFRGQEYVPSEYQEPLHRTRLRELLQLMDEETITVNKLNDLGFGRDALRQAIG